MGSQLSNMFTNTNTNTNTQGVLIDNQRLSTQTNYSINTNTNKIVHTKISSCDYCDKILIDSKENICNICREQLVLKRLQMIGIFN